MTNENDNGELYNFLKHARGKPSEIYEEYRKAVVFSIQLSRTHAK